MGNEEMNNLVCSVVCLNTEKILKIRRGLPPLDAMEPMANIYKALGHPLRLTILRVIALGECCVCDIANVLNKPVSTVSQHLKTLKIAGIIDSQQHGKLVFYALKNKSFIDGEGILGDEFVPE